MDLVAGDPPADLKHETVVIRAVGKFYAARGEVEGGRMVVLQLVVLQPGARRQCDLGHRVGEIDAVAGRDMAFEETAARPCLADDE